MATNLKLVKCGFESLHRHQFMNTKENRIKQEEDYIAFLEKRLNSENYKKNVSGEEYTKTEQKLKKARLVLKILR